MKETSERNVNWLVVELDAAVKEVSSWSDGLRRNIDLNQATKVTIESAESSQKKSDRQLAKN